MSFITSARKQTLCTYLCTLAWSLTFQG